MIVKLHSNNSRDPGDPKKDDVSIEIGPNHRRTVARAKSVQFVHSVIEIIWVTSDGETIRDAIVNGYAAPEFKELHRHKHGTLELVLDGTISMKSLLSQDVVIEVLDGTVISYCRTAN